MSLLPSAYLDTVVSIENQDKDSKFNPIATGFLVGFKIDMKNENGEELYGIFLVTNRHVFSNKSEIWIRFNKKEGSSRYKLELFDDKGTQTWSTHPTPEVDIAVIPISVDKLQQDGIQFSWIPEEVMAFSDTRKALGIAQGDEIFVLGFPMGIAGEEKNYAIVRGGIIARLDEEIIRKSNSFLIDSSIFPGNSGSPVILKPSFASIGSEPPVNTAYLLGVVSSYIFYEEMAYSLQTEIPQPRISFRENSGLALAVPMDYVKDIISVLVQRKETTVQEEKQMATKADMDIIPTVKT